MTGLGEESISAEELIADQGPEAYISLVADHVERFTGQLEALALLSLQEQFDLSYDHPSVFALSAARPEGSSLVVSGRFSPHPGSPGAHAATLIDAESVSELIPELPAPSGEQ